MTSAGAFMSASKWLVSFIQQTDDDDDGDWLIGVTIEDFY